MSQQLPSQAQSPYFKELTKAAVLEDLAKKKIKKAKILPQFCFSYKEWSQSPEKILAAFEEEDFSKEPVIVRSSAFAEDRDGQSMAGAYTSIVNVSGQKELKAAVEDVFCSFGSNVSLKDEVFIQPMAKNIASSGVAFTIDPSNGAPYYVIDHAVGEDTTAVTSGKSIEGKTLYIHYTRKDLTPPGLTQVVDLADELIDYTGHSYLDIEFGIDKNGQLYLFQLRPLHAYVQNSLPIDKQTEALRNASSLLERINLRNPYTTGSKTILGNMPDWNPAEMIGVRPRPLALSMYKEMITDRIWAYQRDKYGYKNLRSSPLMYSLAGCPFIDVRTSFLSFVPKMVSAELSAKLVDYYIQTLETSPELHDKIEFDIVFSCYTPSLPNDIQKLKNYGFSEAELTEITVALKHLTNRMTHTETGEWRVDLGKIDILKQRQLVVQNSDLPPYEKLFWLTEDCKRYGTLAFAGLARAAFVATQFLKSLSQEGILSQQRIEGFWQSLETISTSMARDFANLDRVSFLDKYGHLRPGTYDILSESYEEAPEKYFDWFNKDPENSRHICDFQLSHEEEKSIQTMLDTHGIQHTPSSLFRFFKTAIEGREYGKYVFSWSVNNILKQMEKLGTLHGFSREDCSYINFQSLLTDYAYSGCIKTILAENIVRGKQSYEVAKQITLPGVITKEEDLWCFSIENGTPNFVTMGNISGETLIVDQDTAHEGLGNKIVFIESADPGYDWILNAGIKGFVTCYGGANSHMAVRAMELGLPAVIGVGERSFKKWVRARKLQIDCAAKQVTVLS